MSTDTRKNEPQLDLGLKYPGNRFLQYLHHRLRRIFLILEQFSYWRSPLVWLVIFLNGVFAYLTLSLLSGNPSLPPTIPIFFYAGNTEHILFETSLIPAIVLIHLATQLLVLVAGARVYFKLKDLSRFLLIMSSVLTLLFFLALYRSIITTTPTLL